MFFCQNFFPPEIYFPPEFFLAKKHSRSAAIFLVIRKLNGKARHKLWWICKKPLQHLSFKNDVYPLLATWHSFLFNLASISGKIRLQKAEPGHKLWWICNYLVWHVLLRNPVYQADIKKFPTWERSFKKKCLGNFQGGNGIFSFLQQKLYDALCNNF